MADVSIRQVNKLFGEVRAVNDVSLDIHDGEFLVLLGPSGCGKTTLLRMIAGLESPTSGEIVIGDRVVNFVPPKDRDIAMVFQNYALYPHMDVESNITLGLRLHHTPKSAIKERLDAASVWLQLSNLLKRTPRQLSGGQQQRVALGRSVVREPKVFLMDEPLSNLDARLRVNMRTELIKLHRRLGATIVYVTHDQSEAMTMATRAAIMRNGVLQQCDAPLKIYRHPANKYVAAFMGNPEMNFLQAELMHDGDRWTLVGPSFRLGAAAGARRRAGPTHAHRRLARDPAGGDLALRWRARSGGIRPLSTSSRRWAATPSSILSSMTRPSSPMSPRTSNRPSASRSPSSSTRQDPRLRRKSEMALW